VALQKSVTGRNLPEKRRRIAETPLFWRRLEALAYSGRSLPEWGAAGQEASLLYPSRRYQPLRATIFMQFMAERIPLLPGFAAPVFRR
jgi:hypothetical protein